MRYAVRILAVLALLAIGAATASAASHAATPQLRCPKGTKLVKDAKRRPRACLGATPTAAGSIERQVQRLVAAGLGRAPKKAKRSKLAARRTAELQQRLQDISKPLPGVLQRQDFLDDLGDPTHSSESADGTTGQATWVDRDGMDVEVSKRHEDGADGQVGDYSETELTVRQRGSGGETSGATIDDRMSRCPTAAGVADGSYALGLVKGKGVFSHGKRTWATVRVRIEGTVTGHVGMEAKAKTFDAELRATVEGRGWTEIAATGKVVKRLGTSTFHAYVKRNALPVDLSEAALVEIIRGIAVRGPHGAYAANQGELNVATATVTSLATAVLAARDQVVKGDQRWYDNRACATIDYTAAPGELSPGDTASWDAEVHAADGSVPSDATWTASTSCAGTFSPTSARGPKARFTAVEAGGDWSRDPDRHACIRAEALSPAGRSKLLDHTIFAKEQPKGRYRFTISVTYHEDRGVGVVPTDVVANGSVEAEVGGGQGEGTGTWSGTEWDSGIGNACGQDMQRLRNVTGATTATAKLNDDSTATVFLMANERPLALSWLVTVPLSASQQVITGVQPFCGTPGGGKTTSTVTVEVQQLSGA